MKKITITVDITLEVPDHIDPNEVTCEFNYDQFIAFDGNNLPIRSAKVIEHATR